MSTTTGGGEFSNPLRKFKLVFLGEQSGKQRHGDLGQNRFIGLIVGMCQKKLLKLTWLTTSFCQLRWVSKSAFQPWRHLRHKVNRFGEMFQHQALNMDHGLDISSKWC